MSTSALSEETLRDILSRCLLVSHAEFFKFPTQVPRHSKSSRNSRLLLVSKQWLRIGKPLLYSSVTLLTTIHTRSVAAVLKDDPKLGLAIRSMRLEGGYCKELQVIADLASNVKNLYINLEVLSSDSIVGLRKSLPLLHPTVLYLHQVNLYGLKKQNKNIDDLRRLLEASLTKRWDKLVSAPVGTTVFYV